MPRVEIDIFSTFGFVIFIKEIFIGFFFGFLIKSIFSFFYIVGELISLQMGFSFSVFFDFTSRSSISIISKLLNVFTALFFLSLNGHLFLIKVLFYSFQVFPINVCESNIYLNVFSCLTFFKLIFLKGIILSFPFSILLLLLNISISILNRLSPQFSIFSLGFSIILLFSLFFIGEMSFLLFHHISFLMDYLTNYFS